MKQRKIILMFFFICYILATAGCMLYYADSKNILPAFLSADTSSRPDEEPQDNIPTVTEYESESIPETETESENVPKTESESESIPETDVPAEPPTEVSAESDSPEAEDTFTPIPFVCHTKSRVNIRDIPDTSGTIIGKIPNKMKGEITELTNDEWVQVHYQDIIGYCASRYLEFALPTQNTSQIEESSTTENVSLKEKDDTSLTKDKASADASSKAHNDAKEQNETLVILSGCYVRSTPEWRASNNIIRVAEEGDVYPHITQKDTPNFYAIRLPDNRTAYVSVDYSEPSAGEASPAESN